VKQRTIHITTNSFISIPESHAPVAGWQNGGQTSLDLIFQLGNRVRIHVHHKNLFKSDLDWTNNFSSTLPDLSLFLPSFCMPKCRTFRTPEGVVILVVMLQTCCPCRSRRVLVHRMTFSLTISVRPASRRLCCESASMPDAPFTGKNEAVPRPNRSSFVL
jgi:hypothetical protein